MHPATLCRLYVEILGKRVKWHLNVISIFVFFIFTARRYAKRGIIVTADRLPVCLSVCPSVALRYPGRIGWNTSKIISWLINRGFLLSADPVTSRIYNPEFWPE